MDRESWAGSGPGSLAAPAKDSLPSLQGLLVSQEVRSEHEAAGGIAFLLLQPGPQGPSSPCT